MALLNSVMGRGESALQAGAGAAKNRKKDNQERERQQSALAAQKENTAAINSLSGNLIGKESSGGGKGGEGGEGIQAPNKNQGTH